MLDGPHGPFQPYSVQFWNKHWVCLSFHHLFLNATINLEGHQAVDKNLALGLRAPSKPFSAQVVSHPPAPPGHGHSLRARARH